MQEAVGAIAKMRIPSFCAALIALVLLAYLLTGKSSTPVVAQGESGEAGVVAFADRAAWLDRLKSKARVQFVERAEVTHEEEPASLPVDREVAELTSLGRVVGADYTLVEGLVANLYQMRSKKLLELQSSMSTTSLHDAFLEARAALDVEVAMSMQKNLVTGDYITLPPQQSLPSESGLEITSMGIHIEGKPANIWFTFDGQLHPHLVELRRYVGAVQDAWLDRLVDKFNGLDLSVRNDLISRFRDRQLVSRSKWTASDWEQQRTWFPVGVHVDRRSSMLAKTVK